MMPDNFSLPAGDQAREHLVTARQLAAGTARRGAVVGSITTAGVGLLVAGALAAAFYFTPHRPGAFAVSFAVYGVLLGVLMLWHRRAQVVSQRGFGRAYVRAFVITMVLYSVGVAVLRQRLSWPLMAAYCALVALPMVLAGARMAAGARR